MKAVRLIAIITLLFLGISSCAGGLPLIMDPSGGILKMPLTLLDHSPFSSFLIPGLILLLMNGVLSLAISIAVVRKARTSGSWTALQGCVLFGWITIQVVIIRQFAWPHLVYWGVALVLIVSGWILRKGEGSAPQLRTAPASPTRP